MCFCKNIFHNGKLSALCYTWQEVQARLDAAAANVFCRFQISVYPLSNPTNEPVDSCKEIARVVDHMQVLLLSE